VGRCMVSAADWVVLGILMGRKIYLCEMYWETIDCRTVHSGELHIECC